MTLSYATIRKIRILEERLGADWRTKHPGVSVDRLYTDTIGDVRKNLFCKISPEVKAHLDEMREHYEVDMSELIEELIEREHVGFVQRKSDYLNDLVGQFAK